MTFPGLIFVSVVAIIAACAIEELRPLVEFGAVFLASILLVGMGYVTRRGVWYVAAAAAYGLGLARLL